MEKEGEKNGVMIKGPENKKVSKVDNTNQQVKPFPRIKSNMLMSQ